MFRGLWFYFRNMRLKSAHNSLWQFISLLMIISLLSISCDPIQKTTQSSTTSTPVGPSTSRSGNSTTSNSPESTTAAPTRSITAIDPVPTIPTPADNTTPTAPRPSMPANLQDSASNSLIHLNLIYYGVHTASIDSRILNARPQYVIINPPHGLWGQISKEDAFQNISEYQAAGIKVIGYITAGYEGTHSDGSVGPQWYTLAMNEEFIKNMAEIDHVDGVFIDECTNFPSDAARAYLKTLTDLAHSDGLITWGNVGEARFDPWYFTDGGFDLMQSREDWDGQSLSQVQNNWGSRISVSGLSKAYTAQDAYNLTKEAWQEGIAYCYISTSYETLPPWFEDYIVLLRS